MSAQAIQLYNTLSRKKETFKPLKEGKVSIYTCGPTVYGLIHVGNARAVICPELLGRTFRLAGYEVEWCRNYTDIDDKIIKRSKEEGIDCVELTEKYIAEYEQDTASLNLNDADHKPKATECIPDMVAMIVSLIEKELAYVAETPFGKDVYFKPRSFESYGKLSNRALDDMQTGTRIEVGEAKEDPLDFVLWKAAKPGEPHWASPWGEGRPGWHIECSAMIKKIFPDGLDIHTGGLDLIFPHHENEIAQSEACCNKALANYWVHNGLLVIGKEKMSKSLGNFFTAREFIESFGAETLKLMCLQYHYRSPMDFSEVSILSAEVLLEKLYKAKEYSQQFASDDDSIELPSELGQLEKKIKKTLFDDINTAKALGLWLSALRLCKRENKPEYWASWHRSLKLIDEAFGFLVEEPKSALAALRQQKLKRCKVTEGTAKGIEEKLLEREQHRKNKNFSDADKIRDELLAKGFKIMDSPEGSTWSLSTGVCA